MSATVEACYTFNNRKGITMTVIKPTQDAMLLCDNIITEIGTGKKSLIGIFEHINFTGEPPWRHYRMSVYVKFTSAQGKYSFQIELVDLDNDQIIGKASTPELNAPNKLDSYELAFNLENVVFQHHGKYEFRVYAGNDMFANKTFNVIKR